MPIDLISQGHVASAGFQLRMHNISVIMGTSDKHKMKNVLFFKRKQGSVIFFFKPAIKMA